MVSNRPGNMLLNAFLQHLECASYVPTIAVAHKLMENIIVVMGNNTGTSFLVAEKRGLVVTELFQCK